MNKKSLLMGFLIGGISAGVATLLSAPSSGKETRTYMKENTQIWKEQILELTSDLDRLKSSFTVLTKEGKDGISSFIKDVKILVETWKIDMKPHEEQLKKELQTLQNSIQELESTMK
ncbi:YtxH domain-containing protein [Robertmurraya massiliosenegalensis]|uniref:YtxH domain-containing protein n=1 Tax=Robertmurraya massiliosenegalensis TaxID=1287657 RepID=UPI0002F1815D|nr:YtxH domain-containing protein [Robertmurraya massiliosenegalensis]